VSVRPSGSLGLRWLGSRRARASAGARGRFQVGPLNHNDTVPHGVQDQFADPLTECSPSLLMILLRWVSAVFTLRFSSEAASFVLFPSPSNNLRLKQGRDKNYCLLRRYRS